MFYANGDGTTARKISEKMHTYWYRNKGTRSLIFDDLRGHSLGQMFFIDDWIINYDI